MLLLTRKPNESIVITTEDGQRITITVINIRGEQVRLGFDADDSIEF